MAAEAHKEPSYLRENVSTSRGGNVIPSLESFVVATSPFSHHTHVAHLRVTCHTNTPRANILGLTRAPPIEQKSLIIEDSISTTKSKITDHPLNNRYPTEICWCTHKCISGRPSTTRNSPPHHTATSGCALSDTGPDAAKGSRDRCNDFYTRLSRIDRSFDHRSNKGTTHRSNVEKAIIPSFIKLNPNRSN